MFFFGAVLLTCCVPFAGLFAGIVIKKAPSQFGRWLWVYIMFIAIVAYSYTPTYTNDLIRYFNMIEACKSLPFSQSFSWGDDGLIVKNFWFWCVGQINEPHLIQAITIGGLYGVTAFITWDSFSENRCSMWIVILVQILLLPLQLANNNIRNMFTFSFMFFAVYRDLVKKKRNVLTAILYIGPIFVHMAGLAVIMARIGMLLFRKHYKLGLTLTFSIPFVILSAYPVLSNVTIPGNIGKIIKRAIWKSYTSVLSNSAYALSMQESGYINACRVVMFIACVSIIILTLRYLYKTEEKTSGQNEYMIFNMIFCSITCMWILLGAVKFWVFAVGSIIGSGPVLSRYYEEKKPGQFEKILILVLEIMGICRAALELYYINQRIVWVEYFTTLFSTNIWTILIHIIRELMRI